MNDFEAADIKVVFMDIGGVLLTDGWGHQSRREAAELFGFDYEEMNDLHNFIYNIFEIGSISLEEYLDTILFNRPRDFSKAEFKEFFYAQSRELPNMLNWMKSWKNEFQLPLFALSNESRELNDYRIQKFKLNELFDGFFSSCYLGFRKPDPGIYKQAIEIVHVKPEECLYIDDRQLLVNAGRKMGMKVLQHKEFKNTKYVLEKVKKRV